MKNLFSQLLAITTLWLYNCNNFGGAISFPSSAETTIHGFYPNNNFGTVDFLAAGLIGRDAPVRAIFRFPLDNGQLPPTARIVGAQIDIPVVHSSLAGAPECFFTIHRLT